MVSEDFSSKCFQRVLQKVLQREMAVRNVSPLTAPDLSSIGPKVFQFTRRAFSSGKKFRLLALIWMCFLVRGFFYCSFMPLWEGYDEWAHFAYIQRLVTNGQFLVDRNDPVSREVTTSLQTAPVPWELRYFTNPSVTEDDYWRLSTEERAKRNALIGRIPRSQAAQRDLSGAHIYEALQPPVYYWLLSVPYRLLWDTPLLNRVFVLRFLSLFIAAFSIPISYLIALRVTGRSAIALLTCALIASMPGLMVDVSRIGNECLGIVLYSWLILLCTKLTDENYDQSTALWTGVALGLGLITKAYFLAAIPALFLLYFWRLCRVRERLAVCYLAVARFGSAFIIAGWWYVYNRITTGTWSGLSESVMLLNRTPGEYLSGLVHLPWLKAVDAVLLSHIWFGGWSSLGLRSWMYHVFYVVIAIAIAGIIREFWRSEQFSRTLLVPLIAVYGCFWVGQLYNVLLLFLSKGAPTSMGWYMYCVVSAEATLLVAGLMEALPRRWSFHAISIVIVCLAAVDLYSVNFVSIPYYTGFTVHLSGGSVGSFHVDQLRRVGLAGIFERLSANKPVWLTLFALEVEWVVYVTATVVLAAIPFMALAKIGRLPGKQSASACPVPFTPLASKAR